MLINVDPLLSPEILSILRSMGHGDRFILSDANFPSYSHNSTLIRMDGLDIPQAAKAMAWFQPTTSAQVSGVPSIDFFGWIGWIKRWAKGEGRSEI